MAYLVLARKYRPERFADMVGQEHVTRTIANAIREDRVHHAYLFCGVRGLGKTTAARILAKCLVCDAGPTAEPCNRCAQCRAVTEGRSVDVLEIDGASNNKVEHVRALREQVVYLPQSARRKVYIIDEVHMLTDSAFNALLKTLEEPPPHVTFVFATTDPHKVLPTILSRVSRLDFRRVASPALTAHLKALLEREGIRADEDALHLVVRAAEGSVRDALTLLDKVIAFAGDPRHLVADEVRTILGHADRFAVADLLDAVLARDARATLDRFDEITRTGSDLLQIAIAVLQHLRDLVVLRLTGARECLLDVSDVLHERMTAQIRGVETVALAQAFDRFSRVLDGLDASHAPRLAVEMALLDLVHAEPLIPVQELVSRLDALATGAAGPTGTGGTRGATPASVPPTRSSPGPGRSAAPPTPATPPPTELPAPVPDSPFVRELLDLVPAEFALRPPGDPPAETPSGPPADLGPPSSRSVPREPIAWRTMDPFVAWGALLEGIRGEDEPLFAVLAELGLARLSPGVLELAAPHASFARAQLAEHPELRAGLHRFLEELFGEPFELRLVDAAPNLPELPSLALVEVERRRTRQAEVETRAGQNPRIRALIAAFDARIREVRPLDADRGSGP